MPAHVIRFVVIVNAIVRIVGLREVAVTRPLLERAQWRCESCNSPDDIRVVQFQSHDMMVLCTRCRLRAGLRL